MKLDIGDVAFRGFSLVWKKPLVVLAWAAVYLFAMIVIFVGGGAILVAGAGGDASGIWNNPASAAGGIVFILVGFLLLSSAMLCAAYRVVLRPDASSFAYLGLGMTELRMALMLLALAVIAIVLGLVLMLLIGIFIAAALQGSEAGSLVASLIVWGFLAVLSVRFSLTGVVNFAEGKFGLVESWEITRGNFWTLFAVYLILFVFWIIISLLAGFIGTSIQVAMGLPNPWASLLPQAAPPLEPVSPMTTLAGFLVSIVINVVASAVNNMILYAPHAAAYAALTAPGAETTSEVFS